MKSLFTVLLAAAVVWIFVTSEALGGEFDRSDAAQTVIAGVVDTDNGTPVVVATFRSYGRHHGYYGGHYGRGDYYYPKHWRRYGPSHYFGRGYFYKPYYPYYPYRYYDYGYGYYRPYGFGFSVCFRSGGVRVCINESYPYRYR